MLQCTNPESRQKLKRFQLQRLPGQKKLRQGYFMDLQDKVIAITGGGRGLGRAMAVQFAERGAKLALVDLDQEALDVTASLCEEVGSQARTYQANVASGALHGLVNNAGITRDGLFVKVKDGEIVNKMSLEQWQQVIDVNLTGTLPCR
jgi:3-oxoacyl-[acyl-carrier protein] reductase